MCEVIIITPPICHLEAKQVGPSRWYSIMRICVSSDLISDENISRRSEEPTSQRFQVFPAFAQTGDGQRTLGQCISATGIDFITSGDVLFQLVHESSHNRANTSISREMPTGT